MKIHQESYWKHILKWRKVIAVKHYGGELKGNEIRSLNKNGDDTYENISAFSIDQNNDNKIGNSNGIITNDERSRACKDYGNLFCLFDNVFSILNKKGTFDE